MATTIKINGGVDRRIDVDADTPLLWVLRDVLEMSGTKFGCGRALCGACTVQIDGVATRSCVTPVDGIDEFRGHHNRNAGARAAGAKISEGLA